jgi:ACS family pantothenate transporter-like MFS transporter
MMSASKQERKLVLKIDCFILSYCCLMVRTVSSISSPDLPTAFPVLYKLYVLKISYLSRLSNVSIVPSDLDRSNVNNAYVSGMKQDLNMQGNEFNVGTLLFTSHTLVTSRSR